MHGWLVYIYTVLYIHKTYQLPWKQNILKKIESPTKLENYCEYFILDNELVYNIEVV